MIELAAFVADLRAETGDQTIPDFDPLDGGADAECLFLLEAPGPRAVASGFVSRNNPDETAKNWWELNRAAGISRSRTVTWNIVPWYLGENGRIRAARGADIGRGLSYLQRLLALLPNLRLVVLVGRKAGRAEQTIRAWNRTAQIMSVRHPSPTFVNRAPVHREHVLHGLLGARERLEGSAMRAQG